MKTVMVLAVYLSAFCMVSVGCDGDDSYSPTDDDDDNDDNNDASGDSDADSDADSDGDSDADSDADGDADTDDAFCETDEVQQPYTDLCWRRCPVGQEWSGTECEGTAIVYDWCDASGQTVTSGACSPDNPGVNVCNSLFGEGYRLPTPQELSVLLEEVELGSGGKECDGGDGNTMCTAMFGYDGGYYWSSSIYDYYDAWLGHFDFGYVHHEPVVAGDNVRCLRVGP